MYFFFPQTISSVFMGSFLKFAHMRIDSVGRVTVLEEHHFQAS